MNITNRLEKLEKASNQDSGFCACPRTWKVKIIDDLDLDRTEEEYQQTIAEAESPETCDRCGKVIEHQLIIVEGVKPENAEAISDRRL